MPSRCRPLLGTFVEISADDAAAIDEAFAAVEHVHRLMSAHEPDSDVSRVNRVAHLESVQVDAWTALVIERALSWSKRSEGSFDVVRAGKAALAKGLIPRHADQPAPEAAHWTWLEIQGHSVRLLRSACIDLGGIAKGFAVDRAIDALRNAGAKRGLVNAGGDVCGFGAEAWPVDVVHPLTLQPVARVELRDAALATSALHNDGSGDHLPTGSDWISVTVQAASACDADALTKIVWASAANCRQLIDECGARAFGIRADGSVKQIAAERMAA
jgi:thiamine biosynthesis lipoprotein